MSEELIPLHDFLLKLNEEGHQSIDKTGFTTLGLRSGYDLSFETPNNGEYTRLFFMIGQLESEFNQPKLEVIYNVKLKSQIKNLGHKN